MNKRIMLCCLIVIQSFFSSRAEAQMVSTYAGSGAAGSSDANGTEASFNAPSDVVIDASGNMYIADYTNSVIRKMDAATLAVSTYAGTAGTVGSNDGARLSATFRNPSGLTIDASGNLYVADRNNHTIRKINIGTGMVSTFAGSAGSAGTTDGTGTAAKFRNPTNIAIDASGNLFVADFNNNSIRKITPAGVVTLFAGSATPGSTGAGTADGAGTTARFKTPYDLVFDASGNLLVTDYGNNTIRKITPAAVVSTFAGSAGVAGSIDGTGTAAVLNGPYGITITNSGDLYVATYIGHKIRKITSGAVVTTYAGSGTSGSADGMGTAASFNGPSGLAADATGNLFVADYFNNKIRKIVPSVPTPLYWLSVSGRLNSHQQALIEWKVNEKEVNDFQVEKSDDGNNFITASRIPSKSNGINSYSYITAETVKEVAYYRIRQTGKDGSSYSAIIRLQNPGLLAKPISAYPNPFTEKLTINSSHVQMATIFDVKGTLLQAIELNAGDNYINTTTFGIGIYYLKMADGRIQTLLKR